MPTEVFDKYSSLMRLAVKNIPTDKVIDILQFIKVDTFENMLYIIEEIEKK